MRNGLAISLIITLSALACSDDSTPTPDAQPSPDITVADMAAPDIAGADIASGICAPIGANECFSNDDCLTERRCEEVDVGGGELYACCVVGARGAGQAGEACDDQNDCASAVCIAVGRTMEGGRCSQTCTQASECPEGMQDCKLIAFSDSDYRWCFPEIP